MSTPAQIKPAPHDGPNPNEIQRRASDPYSSVWVNASAGTGKTKVLTDRVLRLLLPRPNGEPATPAHKILCLTFTRAAASEMAERLSEILGEWAILPDTDLAKELKDLTGQPAKAEDIQAARALFAKVIDVPGGLKIMTIHSFCQSVLGRFPLEANINPQFTLMDDGQAQELITAARSKTFKKTDDPAITAALKIIGKTINEDQFEELLKNIIKERKQFDELNHDYLFGQYCALLQIDDTLTLEKLLRDFYNQTDREKLHDAIKTMNEHGKKTDITAADNIAAFLGSFNNPTSKNLETYFKAFLTGEGKPRAKLLTNNVQTAAPALLDVLTNEAERVATYIEKKNRLLTAQYSEALFTLSRDILNNYERIKAQKSVLDYDDLILKTLKLLQQKSAWVNFKLDEGLDHILVDEAQDTNPEQWKIFESLCDDFFAGQARTDFIRTVFVVGDEKQSIYSFQRASPEEFQAMKNRMEEKVTAAGYKWDPVDMNISFRSTQCILNSVDAAFANPLHASGVSKNPIEHISHREGQSGQVELWPLTEAAAPPKQSIWEPPIEVIEQENAKNLLAQNIAATIKHWLDTDEKLPSRERSITAGDIMILVRNRRAIVDHLVRALKKLDIPVSGADRMTLEDQIAVQDLIAAIKFSLLPEDDLNLACLLKSPLIGCDEDTLFTLSHERGTSLWQSCHEKAAPDIRDYLNTLLTQSRTKSPYDLLSWILQSPCPADENGSGRRAFVKRLGQDCLDPLQELLNFALNFERNTSIDLQHFLQHILASHNEIKRESQEKAPQVRIMTVHGSKGLQAPIVILPDTTGAAKGANNKADKRLLWPHQTEHLSLPLWTPRKNTECETYTNAAQTLQDREAQEHRRLLYVAMTRAEDRLYICGAKGSKNPPKDCWYNQLSEAFETQKALFQPAEDGKLRYQTAQDKPADKTKQEDGFDIQNTPLPEWATQKAKPEDETKTPLQPSHIDDEAASPLSGINQGRFLRGNLTHKLLQILPDQPQEFWADKARAYLDQYGASLSEEIRADIARETLAVLNTPEFSALFGPGSLAEVPITGTLADGRPVSGQIDRLVITEDEIQIIDFKSNRPPPTSQTGIPAAYKTQMAVYAEILHQIYPKHSIKCALLWTDGAILMSLDP